MNGQGTASDVDNARLTYTQVMTPKFVKFVLNTQNVNDNTPVFQTGGAHDVTEADSNNPPTDAVWFNAAGRVVEAGTAGATQGYDTGIRLAATDADGDDLAYSVQGGANADLFAIHNGNEVWFRDYRQADFDMVQQLLVTVRARAVKADKSDGSDLGVPVNGAADHVDLPLTITLRAQNEAPSAIALDDGIATDPDKANDPVIADHRLMLPSDHGDGGTAMLSPLAG